MIGTPERPINAFTLEWSPFQEHITFDTRSLPISFYKYNSDFSEVQYDIKSILEIGNLGNFTALPEWQQTIIPQLKCSRKLGFTHSVYPEYVFWITGIGVVTGNNKGNVNVGIPELGKTIFDRVPDMEKGWMETWGMDSDGKDTSFASEQPLGAYWLNTAIEKYDKTTQAQRLLYPVANTAIPVCAGSYDTLLNDQPAGFFVYALPRKSVMHSFLFSIDQPYLLKSLEKSNSLIALYNSLRESTVVRATHQSMLALGYLNRKEHVHRQYHGGNLFYQILGDDIRAYVTDWDTSMCFTGYRQDTRLPQGFTPYDYVQATELHMALKNLSEPPKLIPFYQIPLTVASIMGYSGIQLDNNDIWNHSIDAILQMFRDAHGISLGEILDLNDTSINYFIHDACEFYFQMWIAMSGMFPSLEQQGKLIRNKFKSKQG